MGVSRRPLLLAITETAFIGLGKFLLTALAQNPLEGRHNERKYLAKQCSTDK